MTAVFVLITLRNSHVNFFQTAMSVFLFACNTRKTVYRALNRMAISKSSSALHEHLNQLGLSATKKLREQGSLAYNSVVAGTEEQDACFQLVFDNINKYLPSRRQTVDKKSQMRNGTAATAITLVDVPPGAFDPWPYWKNCTLGLRRSLSTRQLLEDINHAHLEAVGTGMVMRILCNYLPSLPNRLRQELEGRFKNTDAYAVHRLKLRKSTTMSMGTSNIDESTVGGVSDILHDLTANQMGMQPEWFDKLLILVCGDWMSIDRLRKVIRYKATEISVYKSCSWAIPLIQLWHMKVAYLSAVFKIHYFDQSTKELFGLRQSVQALGRNLNSEKCDFYVWHDAVKTTLESMVVTST